MTLRTTEPWSRLWACGLLALLGGTARAGDTEDKAVKLVEALGGTALRDTEVPGKPVVRVVLAFTKVTDAGLMQLSGLKSLQKLDLGDTKVSDKGLKELAGLKSLQTLSLGNTKVTDAGLKVLTEVKSLQSLVLQGTKVTDQGVQELQKALPKCQINR